MCFFRTCVLLPLSLLAGALHRGEVELEAVARALPKQLQAPVIVGSSSLSLPGEALPVPGDSLNAGGLGGGLGSLAAGGLRGGDRGLLPAAPILPDAPGCPSSTGLGGINLGGRGFESIEHAAIRNCAAPVVPDWMKAGVACPEAGGAGKPCQGPSKATTCLNQNIAYSNFPEAWSECGMLAECGKIMNFKGKFYLRRIGDPVVLNGGVSLEFNCRQEDESVTLPDVAIERIGSCNSKLADKLKAVKDEATIKDSERKAVAAAVNACLKKGIPPSHCVRLGEQMKRLQDSHVQEPHGCPETVDALREKARHKAMKLAKDSCADDEQVKLIGQRAADEAVERLEGGGDINYQTAHTDKVTVAEAECEPGGPCAATNTAALADKGFSDHEDREQAAQKGLQSGVEGST